MAKSVLPSLLAVLIFCTTLFGVYEARPHRRGPTPSTIARSASVLGPYSVPPSNGMYLILRYSQPHFQSYYAVE